MNPPTSSQRTAGIASFDLSRSKNCSSLVTCCTLPARSYCQPWYLQWNARHDPDVSSLGYSCHTTLLPRWAHTLWKAWIDPSRSRAITTEASPGSSRVK